MTAFRFLAALALFAAPAAAQDTTVIRCVVGSSTCTQSIARASAVPIPTPVPLPVPIPAPPVISSGASKEPAGMTKFAERDFSTLDLAGWYRADGFVGATQLVSDPLAPRSPNGVVQQNFSSRLAGGSSPSSIGLGGPNKQTIYLAYWMKLSANYVGHPSNVNKTFFLYANGGNIAIPMVRGAGMGTLRAAVNLQGLGLPYEWYSGTTRVFETEANLDPNDQPCVVNRGQWHRYEFVFRNNTPGQRDGTIEWWLDGAHCASYTGVPFVAAGKSNRWDEVNWSPTYGGGAVTITSPFFTQMDHIYISAK